METITACENVCRDFSWLPSVIGVVADFATIAAVGFAFFQVRLWRSQQLATKAQDIAGELLVHLYALQRSLELCGSLPDRRDASLYSGIARWTPDWFLTSAKRIQRNDLPALISRLETTEMLLLRLKALNGDDAELENFRELSAKVFRFSRELNGFIFTAELHRNIAGDRELGASVNSLCDELFETAKSFSPSKNKDARQKLFHLTAIAEKYVSLNRRRVTS